jgi:predicted nucleotidyltransferase
MGNIFNADFRDFIASLNNHGVKYILVGGYSVILHGYSRTTGDMDLWVERSEQNYVNIKNAFEEFGMPVFDMTKENFLHHPIWDVFTFGIPPVAIDLMIKLEGFNFQEVYARAVTFNEDELEIKVIHKNDLIAAKQKAGRSKDLNDLENIL